MPDAQDLLSASQSTPSSQPKQTKTPRKVTTASSTTKTTRGGKSKSKTPSKAKGTEEDSGARWAEDDWDNLFTFILDTEPRNFLRAERKTENRDFWDIVASVGLEGKWDGISARTHWRLGRTIYSIIHQLESFTGGDGDGDEDTRFDDDDDKVTALGKLRQRLETIQSRKPNIDPHRKVKPEIYYNWLRGGDDSWYAKLHQRFKDNKTSFTRQIERGSGRIEDSDDSDGTKSDSTPSSRNHQSKQKRHASALEGMVSIAKDYQDSRKAAAEAKHTVAQQRLDFERERAQVADAALLRKTELDGKLLDFRMEVLKRKWANEEKAQTAEEVAKKRREAIEEKHQQQNLILDQIKALEALISKPDTDEQLKETLRVRVGSLLDKLGG